MSAAQPAPRDGAADRAADRARLAETSRWHQAYKDRQLVARRTSSHRRKLRKLGALALPRDARVLDLACGTGEALRILHEEGFTDLTGTDITIDPDLAKEAWVKVDQADACALPYPEGTFDLVTCMHSLHHLGGVVRIRKTLEEALRVLKPGGRLMVIDHYDSPQLRLAFWGLGKSWLTWPTRALRSFHEQHEEERPDVNEYLDAWHAVHVTLETLGCEVALEERGLFFFYWVGRKRQADGREEQTARGASPDWAQIHEEAESWRRKIVGEISEAYIVPRYVEFFYEHFGRDRGLDVFEISAGTGDISRAILAANGGQIGRYRVSEYFPEGVAWLKAKGLDCIQADAQKIALPDGSFDVVVEFDVMHHVPDCAAMAREMMRLGRSGRCLMVESNGLSLPRKLKELTPSYKRAGERSFTPRQWRRFFEVHPEFRVTRFELFPFLFPLKVPHRMLGSLVRFNRAVERVPAVRWQCSSVAIYLEYERV